MKKTYFVLPAALFCLAALVSAPSFATDWTMLAVDNVGDVGIGASLAIRAPNTPVIAYYDVTDPDNAVLKLAEYTGTDWIIQSVATVGRVVWGFGAISVQLDGAGLPVIAYSIEKALWLARYDGADWTLQPVDVGDGESPYSYSVSMALDAADFAVIAYGVTLPPGNVGELRYTTEESGWVVEVVEAAQVMGVTVVIANGNPVIGYTDLPNARAKLAYWNVSVWDIQGPANATRAVSIVYDGAQSLRVAHVANTSLYVDDELVGFCAPSLYTLSIAVDSNDTVAVAYQAASQLRFARDNGVDWDIEVIDPWNNPEDFELAYDADGYAYIAYYDQLSHDLALATTRQDSILEFFVLPEDDTPNEVWRGWWPIWLNDANPGFYRVPDSEIIVVRDGDDIEVFRLDD